jgi:hypothetical protein
MSERQPTEPRVTWFSTAVAGLATYGVITILFNLYELAAR